MIPPAGNQGKDNEAVMTNTLTIVGGGLAGTEAAWQAAQRGVHVRLFEMRPRKTTPAHMTDKLAELVCSNSLGADVPGHAPGLLKAELRRLDSLLLRCAQEAAVPAGGALAVDRELFSQRVTETIEAHPEIELVRQEVKAIPEGPCIIASGPLTAPALAEDIARTVGQEYLYFYDAIAPLVLAESIDLSIAYRASRYGRGEQAEGDYINCPFDKDTYYAFVETLRSAEKITLRDFEQEDPSFFEGCLPVEQIVRAGSGFAGLRPDAPGGAARSQHGQMALRRLAAPAG